MLNQRLFKTQEIRNICVIAHVDHGKSTLSDALVAKGGLISNSNAGTSRFLDVDQLEKEKGITIKSTGVTLGFDQREHPLTVNLIDSPGHVDFSSEVTAALRVTDGALVVVDCIEGVCVQTETVLRQALTEKIRPVLIINKIDRSFMELKQDPETAYQSFLRSIESFNVIASTYVDEDLGDVQVTPENGTVAFCAGLFNMGFTVDQFARLYHRKFGVSVSKMRKRLWGDHFYDESRRKWYSQPRAQDGTRRIRGFCKFILEPLYQIFDAALEGDAARISHMMDALGTSLPDPGGEMEDLQGSGGGKKLLKYTLSTCFPASEAMLDMIEQRLPSPIQAQRYRYRSLYTGPSDDRYAQAIARCDPDGPLMVFISKLVPAGSNRFYAFGRVFSGTLRPGSQVRIMSTSTRSHGYQVYEKPIQRTVAMLGRGVETLPQVPAGTICSSVGLDPYILKSATLCDADADDAFCFADMKYSVSPVVQMAVRAQRPADTPKLIEGLKRLSKSDPLIQCTTTKSGEHILAGAGELHLEISIISLENDYARVPVIASNPIISYRETVTSHSNQCVLAKSANKLNRLYSKAESLSEDMVNDQELRGSLEGKNGLEYYVISTPGIQRMLARLSRPAMATIT